MFLVSAIPKKPQLLVHGERSIFIIICCGSLSSVAVLGSPRDFLLLKIFVALEAATIGAERSFHVLKILLQIYLSNLFLARLIASNCSQTQNFLRLKANQRGCIYIRASGLGSLEIGILSQFGVESLMKPPTRFLLFSFFISFKLGLGIKISFECFLLKVGCSIKFQS